MIVDSSALVAIIRQEADAAIYSDILAKSGRKLLAAPTYLETSIVVLGRKGDEASPGLERLLLRSGISIVEFSPQAGRVAVSAFLKYGKGRHPARLNFGDFISYAMAKTEALPLLFKGDDFRLTDVESVL